jgi:hypothetical protein
MSACDTDQRIFSTTESPVRLEQVEEAERISPPPTELPHRTERMPNRKWAAGARCGETFMPVNSLRAADRTGSEPSRNANAGGPSPLRTGNSLRVRFAARSRYRHQNALRSLRCSLCECLDLVRRINGACLY